MTVEIICGKCGEMLYNMKMLKPLKHTMSSFDGKCPRCGEALSSSSFSLEAQEK